MGITLQDDVPLENLVALIDEKLFQNQSRLGPLAARTKPEVFAAGRSRLGV